MYYFVYRKMRKYNSLFNQLQKYLTRHTRKKSSFHSREPSTSEKFDFSLSESVENDLLQNKYKTSRHPGIMNVPFVKLPDALQKTILDIKKERSYHDKLLNDEALELVSYIYMRQPPIEEGETQQVVEMITTKLIKEGKLSQKSEGETIHSFEDMSKEEKNRFQKNLKQHVYNWHPITYTEFKSFTYLWARMAGDYAALIRIFSEIQKRRPNFKPRFLFDFGSGVGSVMAAEHVWPKTVQEVFNVDASANMNELSERLFNSGVENNFFQMHKKSTHFRQYLPTSENVKYDLVVSSRTLFEVGDLSTRVRTIDILWKKVAPGGFLVIVETGSMYGYTIMMEIRDYLQEISRIEREKYNYYSPIHVFSPCPHDYSCPRFFHKSYKPCHFSVAYQPLSAYKVNVEKYSYVVFQKEDRDEKNEPAWPRIVQPVLRRHNHVITRTCTPAEH
ncbi:Methyltransferase-like protein 17, mitochondrial [Armadillidium nasatum]|uniref:Methyltransferase-like protein 17, mitochondrial n=1 Tax=Armadillidium nasatum TaxID=96803 RepID=A0A5N5SJ23_9CRUS|nr:Methyltransferase-like protein 17, mitochondrial [Armadillidium nasatum]